MPVLDIADAKQRVKLLELRRVVAEVRRYEASISDGREERLRQAYAIVVAADIDPAAVVRQWFVGGYDFGVKYLHYLDVRWINTGRLAGLGSKVPIAGVESTLAGFRVWLRAPEFGERDEHSSRAPALVPVPGRCPGAPRRSHAVEVVAHAGLVIQLPLAVTGADPFVANPAWPRR